MYQCGIDGFFDFFDNFGGGMGVGIFGGVVFVFFDYEVFGNSNMFVVNFFVLGYQYYRNGVFGGGFEKCFVECFGEVVDDFVVGKENIVFVEQFVLGFVCFEFGF